MWNKSNGSSFWADAELGTSQTLLDSVCFWSVRSAMCTLKHQILWKKEYSILCHCQAKTTDDVFPLASVFLFSIIFMHILTMIILSQWEMDFVEKGLRCLEGRYHCTCNRLLLFIYFPTLFTIAWRLWSTSWGVVDATYSIVGQNFRFVGRKLCIHRMLKKKNCVGNNSWWYVIQKIWQMGC